MSKPTKPTQAPSKRRFPTATEIFVYWCDPPTAKGMTRQLIGNFLRGSSIHRVMRDSGPGRYRIEYRCPKRLIVGVELYGVDRTGEVYRAKPLKKPDKVPPPVFVPSEAQESYR
jgi:hypothetical protein